MLVMVLSLIPIGIGLLFAKFMGWGGIDFSYAVFHESESYIPILIGLTIFIIGLVGLCTPKIHNLIKINFDKYKEKKERINYIINSMPDHVYNLDSWGENSAIVNPNTPTKCGFSGTILSEIIQLDRIKDRLC
ncbi:hypothetical protein [Paenibacillus gansuensis]|uniref:Uncharacterized protein n=1 Tax=Paenibacillus gansuensis TaxID=306542 RepID=A0ABW5P8Z1_9BACL